MYRFVPFFLISHNHAVVRKEMCSATFTIREIQPWLDSQKKAKRKILSGNVRLHFV